MLPTAMELRFRNRTVVITGASAGIGAATAEAFVAAGANVVLAARGANALTRAADAIEARHAQAEVLIVPTDVSNPNDLALLFDKAHSSFGGIDIVVNNAGANRRGEIGQYAPEELADIVDVNLRAPIIATRLALPYLKQSSAAAIVNVASLAGRIPVIHEAVYSATKFGLRAFSMALADELAPYGISVSVVSPGPVETGFIMDDLEHVPDLVFSQPMSSAQQIAELIVACAADGQLERVRPAIGAHLATLGYLFPSLRRKLLPLMERKGRRAKAKYLARQRHETTRLERAAARMRNRNKWLQALRR